MKTNCIVLDKLRNYLEKLNKFFILLFFYQEKVKQIRVVCYYSTGFKLRSLKHLR